MANISERMGRNGTSYRIRVSVGFDKNGRQIIKTKTWKPDREMTSLQAKKALNIAVVDFENAVKLSSTFNESMKFITLSDEYLIKNQSRLAPKTFERYKGLLNSINEYIGAYKLGFIQPHHITSYYDSLSKSGANRRTGGALSQRTILHTHRLISLIFNWAEFQGIIHSNPMRRVKAPKVQKTEAKFLESDELQKVVKAIDEESVQWKTIMLLFLYSGIRRGEALGLEWDDIDFSNNIIRISRTSQYIKDLGIITKSPKNETSKRSIKLDKEAFTLLSDYKAWWTSEKDRFGENWQGIFADGMPYHYCQSCASCKDSRVINNTYCGNSSCKSILPSSRLFIQVNGVPMHPDSFGWWLIRFIDKHNLPKFSAHTLRHTFVTNLIANGVPLPTVSKIVGHSNTTTTVNLYSHSIMEAEQQAMEVTGGLLNPMRK